MQTSTKLVSDHHYLIVGGTTRAATTSLFSYLSDHPSICPASYKETRFFLDDDYPLPSKFRYKGDVEQYNLLYGDCKDHQIRLESTPDYIYCPSALDRISKYLPNAKLVFSLREPISRLVSWFRFAKQNGRLPQDMSFDEYVDELFSVDRSISQDRQFDKLRMEKTNPSVIKKNQINKTKKKKINTEQYLLTLHQGCYAAYLNHYLERIGKARIHILFYEVLTENPLKTVIDLCSFAEIESEFYSDYMFNIINPSDTMRNSKFHQKYKAFRFQVRRWTHNKHIIHNSLRALRRAIEPLYLRLNTRSDESVTVSVKTKRRLVDYYKQDVENLRELIGQPPPWKLYQ